MKWNDTLQIDEICGYRSQNVTLKGLQKSVVRIIYTPYVQVHEISLGRSLFINHTADMVMIHMKKQNLKSNPVPIINNEFVKHALTRELFLFVCFMICKNNLNISR